MSMNRTSPLRRSVLKASLVTLSALASSATQAAEATQITFNTNMGEIVIQLDHGKAPTTAANFLEYARAGHFTGTVFHRVIPGFVIQGGGYDEKLVQKPTRKPIALEAKNGLKNLRGTLSMARTGDPNSATSQFFVNLVDNGMLDYPNPDGHGYAVFGNVVAGMNVVDRIAKVQTGASPNGMRDVPLKPITILSTKVAP